MTQQTINANDADFSEKSQRELALDVLKVTRSGRWFRRLRRQRDSRETRPEGSQFGGTGWIAQPVHVPVSLRRLAAAERAAGARRSGDPMLVLNMSIFNSDRSWNRIFNPVPQRENVWC